MKLKEVCSCGASFSVDGEEAIKLVREWRRKHKCASSDEIDGAIITSNDTKTETAIGFRVSGLQVEFPERIGWEDE